MRVIGGDARGTILFGPPTEATRPTSDKVRGAIFNVIAASVPGARVLDLFAGTGALGIEALSRGAAACMFVEVEAVSCQVIERNVKKAKVQSTARIQWTTAQLYVANCGYELIGSTYLPPYDVILCDPPYGDLALDDVLAVVRQRALLATDGWLVVEHSKKAPPVDRAGLWAYKRTKQYGDTAVSFWRTAEKV